MINDDYTNQEFWLDVGDGHKIYVQDWGQELIQTPIVFLHGGPGSGSSNSQKNKFDPEKQRVIFFDQRGSGKSLPYGELKNNTTSDLVADIQKILDKLEVDQCILVGGSWGSCLALCYAIENPNKVKAIIIDGVLLGTKQEIDFVDKGSWRPFFPDFWQEYIDKVPEESKEDPGAYYFNKALSTDDDESKLAVYEYNKMESSILNLEHKLSSSFIDFDPIPGKIEMHYLANQCFLEDNYVLSNANKLSMPVKIIAGRYDMVCPPINAYNLDISLPDSQLVWTINGHIKQHEALNILDIFIKQVS